MGNKVISAGTKKQTVANKKEVYVDLDMGSAPVYPKMPSIDYDAYYATLAQEKMTPQEIFQALIDERNPVVTETERADLILRYRESGEYDSAILDWLNKARHKCAVLVNVPAVQNSLNNLFNWFPGERILLPEYGSNLKKLLYRGITPETEEAIVAEIRNSIQEWEPRVVLDEVVNISTVDDTEQNTIKLRMVYHIVGLNNEQFSYTYEYRRATL